VALNPVRALLAAHAQSSWNRARLELGQQGRIAVWLFAAVIGLTVIVPSTVLSFLTGFFIANRLGDPVVIRAVGAFLAVMVLIGGTVGRSRVLDWERSRLLPLSLRSIFAAELLAGLGDLLPALFALIAAALLLGFAMARPELLALIAVPWLCTVGTLLSLRHILGGLAAQFLRRIQLALVVAAVMCAIGAIIVARLGQPRPELLLAALDVLPFTQSIRGLGDALGGRWAPALLRQIYPALTLLLLLILAALTLKREAVPRPAGASRTGATRERLWSFSTPTRGIARLHWVSLMRSSIGVMGLVTPLVVLFVMRRQLAAVDSLWPMPALVSALLLINAAIQLNQFGLDGAGVKSLLLLPIRGPELLAGKTLALAAYQGLQVLLLLGAVGIMYTLGPAQAAAAVCLSGCQFLFNVSVGHWSSVRYPRALPRNMFKNSTKTSPSPMLSFLSFGATLVGTVLFGGVYIVTGRSVPAWQLPIMGLLLGAITLLYWCAVLPFSARQLDDHRERLVLLLG
jgi:hypothetical protein